MLDDDAFAESLAAFLEQASVESTKKLSEYAIKAGTGLWENRETPDPSLITSLLAAILEANGTRISPTLLQKRVRDEVLWNNAEVPWRRLSCWLVFRVSIARYLAMMIADEQVARIQYKAFMCLVHATLLNDIQHVASMEDLEFLKAKLCRRLFKLDRDRADLSRIGKASYDALLNRLLPKLNSVIQETTTRIQDVWEKEKLETTKIIPPLPSKAPQQDLRLSLIASRQYLQTAQKRFQGVRYLKPAFHRELIVDAPKSHIHEFARDFCSLFSLEERIHLNCLDLTSRETDLTDCCLMIYSTLIEYIDKVNICYDGNAEQKSLMLLLVMETWMALDRAACAIFPLLSEFHPVFTSRIMEVLHLSSLSDIARARKIQEYLQTREEMCQDIHMTIFDDPGAGCFAVRYFDESSDASALTDMLDEIQEAAEEDRKSKEIEWRRLSSEYENLTKAIDSANCLYVSSWLDPRVSRHDDLHCPKCQLSQRRSRLRIRIFESPLPEAITLAKVVVFELRCPPAFAAYRDATWAILYRLATAIQETAIDPRLCLGDYSELLPYAEVPGKLSLASTAKSCENPAPMPRLTVLLIVYSFNDALEYEGFPC